MSKEDYTNVYIFELSFFSKTLAKKVAKEIFEKTGQKGILYKTKAKKSEINITFKGEEK
jgi:hypothetical protein